MLTSDMTGRVCVVTGASAGIGAETAVGLARLGATVAVVGRDQERTAETARRVGDAGPPATTHLADFSDLADVRRLAADLLDQHPKIHVLVNNAGLKVAKKALSKDGFEMTIAVNHLAPYLLTRLLLPRLQESTTARIVNVASTAHRAGFFNLDDLNFDRRRWDSFRAYNESKIANILFTRELARRVTRSGVAANCLHPGSVRTQLFRESGFIPFIMKTLPGFQTAEGGAQTSIWLASDPAAADLHGEYVVRKKVHRASRQARNDDLARRLWNVSAELEGLEP
jgi:NAD(P)-dependent dehydrogenase (short-subunit alcohol dehydrogenase family)